MGNRIGELPEATRKERGKRKWRKRWGKRCEMYHPLCGGVLAAGLIWVTGIGETGYVKLLGTVLPAAITVAAILAGFQGTTHAILLTLLRSKIVQQLKRAGLYDDLIGYVYRAVIALLGFVVVAVAIMAVDIVKADPWGWIVGGGALTLGKVKITWPTVNAGILGGGFVYATLVSARVMRLVVKLLRRG